MLSIIIPSRNERYLQNTIDDVLVKAEGEIEVIVVLDGYWPNPPLKNNPRVKIIHRSTPRGMRNAINSAASIARGKYLMKTDAHCCFDKGFDVKLAKDCRYNWTVVPRRYAIDKVKWERKKEIYYDFQYISHPKDHKYPFKGVHWPEYGARKEVRGKKLVDLMTFQGSCWFMHRKRFWELGGEDEENYGTMGAEAQEICLKTWLSGGRCVLNRNTWYAHAKKLKGKYGYKKPMSEWEKSRQYAIKCWTKNRWSGQTRELGWLIDKFRPVPGWHGSKESLRANRQIMERYKLNYGVNKFPRVVEGLNRDGLVELWRDLGYKVGCEVGVARGSFSTLMFKGIPGLKMYLVDPYEDYAGARKRRGKDHTEGEKVAREKMKGFDAVFIKKPSETAFLDIPDNSLDFVYIDGNHKYDYVMLDILLWSRKVKKGGMVSGHDYYDSTNRVSKCAAKSAVDDFTRFHKIMPWYLTDKTAKVYRADRHASWFWIK